MKKITILTSCEDSPDLVDGSLGLYWFDAPDSLLAKRYPKAIPLQLLLAETETMHALASKLTLALLQGEPQCRNIPQLTIFQEIVALEFHKALRIIELHKLLIAEGYQRCEFASTSWLGDGLVELVKLIESPLKVSIPTLAKANKLHRVYRRIVATNFSFKSLYDEFCNAVNLVDKFHYRTMVLRQEKKIEKHKNWVYSTAINYSNICLKYEPFFPEPFYFLIENGRTGGKPLSEARRPYASLYSFAQRQFIPSAREIEQSVHALAEHLQNSSFTNEALIAKNLFLNSPWLSMFFMRLIPSGLYLSSICKNWLQSTEPSALIVGNHGFEAYALYQARSNHIPTMLLQHGLLGRDYPYFDYPVDYYLVRGKFWQKLLSPSSKERALVLNPPSLEKKITETVSKKNYLVFVTTPERVSNMSIEYNAKQILKSIIQALDKTSIQLIIRVHPLESLASYKKLMNRLLKQTASRVCIQYSQGSSVDELIAPALAVIMLSSTIFLDCIKYQVPIISFHWIHFGFMERIKAYEVFYLAKSLLDLEELIVKAGQGKLAPKLDESEQFLANTTAVEMKENIQKLLGCANDRR